MADRIHVTVLPDGSIRSVTDEIGQENHQAAEGFLDALTKLTGGKAVIEKRGDHVHVHEDEHTHVHHA